MIKVGDRVRARFGVPNYYEKGDEGVVTDADACVAFVNFGHAKQACVGFENLEAMPADSDQAPPASQDWTPHDRYTAAALTGLLAGPMTMKDAAGFVGAARVIADLAMAARGGE